MNPDAKPKGIDRPSTRTIMKVMGTAHTRLYRLSGGRVGRSWRIGAGLRKPAPVCLLTTTGRRTGQPRTVPLVYVCDGANIVLIASQGGRAENPMWYGNLVAHPEVEIEIGRIKRVYVAHAATGTERDRLWQLALETYSDYATYQAWTDREIPVVVCEPR